jgi:hypothetical protein
MMVQIRGKYANGDSKPKLEKVHRLVAQHFLPEPDKIYTKRLTTLMVTSRITMLQI